MILVTTIVSLAIIVSIAVYRHYVVRNTPLRWRIITDADITQLEKISNPVLIATYNAQHSKDFRISLDTPDFRSFVYENSISLLTYEYSQSPSNTKSKKQREVESLLRQFLKNEELIVNANDKLPKLIIGTPDNGFFLLEQSFPSYPGDVVDAIQD